jgi:hypothetical protein
VKRADKAGGSVVERACHQALLATLGRYLAIFNSFNSFNSNIKMANTADNSPHVFPGFRIGDIYRLYDDDRLEEFADAAIEILNNRDDNRLSRLHRIQLMAMLVCVMDDFNFIDITYDTACREMDILKSNSGSYAHNPNYGPHIQRLEQTLESAHQVLERRRVELFGEEEAEVEDEDNSEEDNSEDTGDDTTATHDRPLA